MSYSISTLLTRNLHDVFGENDRARRRAAIDEIFTEDCVFCEPRGVYRGRDEIDLVAGRDQGYSHGIMERSDSRHPSPQVSLPSPSDTVDRLIVRLMIWTS